MASMIKFCSSLLSKSSPSLISVTRPSLRRCFCSSIKQNGEKNTTDLRVSDWDRRILVWTKKYKTADEVPEIVPREIIIRAHSKFRVKLANIMIVILLGLSVVAAISGKGALSRGETVAQGNRDWHKAYNAKEESLEKKE